MKDYEFMMKQMENVGERIAQEDEDELIRPDMQENELLSKYRRWEKLLDEQLLAAKTEESLAGGRAGQHIREGKSGLVFNYYFRLTSGGGQLFE